MFYWFEPDLSFLVLLKFLLRYIPFLIKWNFHLMIHSLFKNMLIKKEEFNKFSNRVCAVCLVSHIRPFVTPWTGACQAPLSMGFFGQEYWNGLPGLPPGTLPNPGIKPTSPTLQVDSSPSKPPGKPKATVTGYRVLHPVYPFLLSFF